MSSSPRGEFDEPVTVGRLATLVCLWEVMASKPGNVHRGADFEDLSFADFVTSAWAIGPVLDRIEQLGVGGTIHRAIAETRRWVDSNTNLGMMLALAPIAAAAVQIEACPSSPVWLAQQREDRTKRLRQAVGQTLSTLTPEDSREVYRAIRLAVPGGMGKVEEHDIQSEAPASLLEAMRLAEDRDRIARLYVTDYDDLFGFALPTLESLLKDRTGSPSLGGIETSVLLDVIVGLHVEIMAKWPDSLIARKCGVQLAEQARQLTERHVVSQLRFSDAWWDAIRDLDFWLRADGHRRNPGTTADLVCATLYAKSVIDGSSR